MGGKGGGGKEEKIKKKTRQQIVKTYSDDSKKLQMFTRSQKIKEDVMLRADSYHLTNDTHSVGVSNIVTENQSCSCGGRR